MRINSIKTHKITVLDTNILDVLDLHIKSIPENSVLAVTSKIVSICEGSQVKIDPSVDKDRLIEEMSQLYIPRASSKYNISFTVTNNILSASAGIDESNGNGFYILWPKDPQKTANQIREHFVQKFDLKKFGVIITDSKTTPLRWGVTGIALAHSGFSALKDYVGQEDLFGRPFVYEKLNIADSLAAAAVLIMGEGSEQTPLALIEDLTTVDFNDANPDEKEIDDLKIKIDEDLFAPFLKNALWQKGGKK